MQKEVFKNVSYSVGANIINFLAATFIAFIMPRFLGVAEYAYWQLYSFYVGYKGIAHLGFLDGIYLKYGGKCYEELDKQLLHEQLILLFVMECTFGFIIISISSILLVDSNKQFVFVSLGIAVVIYLLNTFFQFILQTTNEIIAYSKCVLIERVIYAVLVIGMLFGGIKSFKGMIIADLLAGCCTLAILMYTCKGIVNEKFKDVSRAFSEAIDNIKIGSKLLLGNIGGTLIIGSARQMIEIYWGIETFGKISLALSISNMLMVLISGMSLVLYPMIKNVSRDRVHSLYPFLLCSAKIVIMWGLLLYFPCEKIFTWWLPLYKESFLYMALLFPICLFEGLYYLLSATYLKAFRKEKVLLIINWLTVLVEIILLLLARNSLICIVLTILISLGLRCYLGLGYLSRILNQKFWKDFLWDIFMVSCFVYCAWTKKYICVFIYVISLYLYMMRNKQWKDLFI